MAGCLLFFVDFKIASDPKVYLDPGWFCHDSENSIAGKIFYGNTVTKNIELLDPLLPQIHCLCPQSWLSGFGKVTFIQFRVYIICVGK